MKLSIPLTGRLLSYNPIIGDENDPVRPVEIDLGNVRWTLIALDLDNDLALIEVTPAEEADFDTGRLDKASNPIYERRLLTEQEKRACLDTAAKMLLDKSADELYAISKSPRLIKPKLSKKRI